jgi:hypothetical protein
MQYAQALSTSRWAAGRTEQPAAVDHIRSGPGWLQGVSTMAAASGLSFIFPVAILLIGTPLALAVRGIVELLQWLLA